MAATRLHERLAAVLSDIPYRKVADRTNTPQETVRRYLAGQTPSAEFLMEVCRVWEINGEWLLSGRGPMHAKDIKGHSLQAASASELLTSLAVTLERLTERVAKLELFVSTMETRLRVAREGAGSASSSAGSLAAVYPGLVGGAEFKPSNEGLDQAGSAHGDGGLMSLESGHGGQQRATRPDGGSERSAASAGDGAAARARGIADAITKPARSDDR